MSKKIEEGRQLVIDWAIKNGFQLDKWGNYKNAVDTDRIKLNPNKVRFEVKRAGSWMRIKSGYYSKISIGENGKLKGLDF